MKPLICLNQIVLHVFDSFNWTGVYYFDQLVFQVALFSFLLDRGHHDKVYITAKLRIGRRMSIQKMQFRCTPRGTT